MCDNEFYSKATLNTVNMYGEEDCRAAFNSDTSSATVAADFGVTTKQARAMIKAGKELHNVSLVLR